MPEDTATLADLVKPYYQDDDGVIRQKPLIENVPDPEHKWLRANVVSDGVQVDKQNNVIHGYVVAQEGVFKSEGRGEFDHKSLRQIQRLMRANENGTKVRFGHPTMSDDGLGKFLGRAKSPRLDHVLRDGEQIEAIRADLHLDASAFDTPAGDLGSYVLKRAESDPSSFSSSLVLKSDLEQRLDSKGRPKLDDEGHELPPLWRPTEIHASDVVDTGDAVDGFLSVEELPDGILRRGVQMLDEQFAGKSREFVEAHCARWLMRYLDHRFGPLETEESVEPSPVVEPIQLAPDPYDDPVPEPYDPDRDPDRRRRRLRLRGILKK